MNTRSANTSNMRRIWFGADWKTVFRSPVNSPHWGQTYTVNVYHPVSYILSLNVGYIDKKMICYSRSLDVFLAMLF